VIIAPTTRTQSRRTLSSDHVAFAVTAVASATVLETGAGGDDQAIHVPVCTARMTPPL
jgi:hypothetical protein